MMMDPHTVRIESDYTVLALPIEVLSKIQVFDSYQQEELQILAKTCLHMQTAIQVYFDCPISLGQVDGYPGNSFLLTDAPWDLIVLQYDQAYDLHTKPLSNSCVKLCNKIPNARGGWSIAICTAYRNGLLIKKPFFKCTYDEMKREIWAQLCNCKKLDPLVQKYNGNMSLASLEQRIVHWSPIWPDFEFSRASDGASVLKSHEPKFTNNAGSAELRPSFASPLPPNMFVATAYISETIDIFSMEAGCIAGKTVASAITGKQLLTPLTGRPALFAPLRAVDAMCYSLGLPNVVTLFLYTLLLLAFLATFIFLQG